MKATALEFRFRMFIVLAIVLLGFLAPWIDWLHSGPRTTTWLWLAFKASELGLGSTTAFQIVTSLTILVAAMAALLRVWGTAYLGAGTVNNAEMKAGQVLADGPYRHLRNPLYLGTWFMIAAISTLMPPTGAAVSLILLALFFLRIILGEEAFLQASLGEPYAAYRRAVPRLIPSPWPRVPASGEVAHWGRSLLSEIMTLGVLASFAFLSWSYNATLLQRAILISFGLSLVTRAALQQQTPPA